MHYAIQFTPKAERMFLKLPSPVQERLRPKINALAGNPRPAGVAKLAGKDKLYRFRAGDYRVIYTIEDRKLTVLVVAVGERGGIYKEV